MPRIISQHGNVIAADFRPRASLDLTVTFKRETPYADDSVMLLRLTTLLDGKPFGDAMHFAADQRTGRIVML
jgi:hypothetical protein